MSKIKEVMLLALVADGSIEMKIADAGKVVNTDSRRLKSQRAARCIRKEKKEAKIKMRRY